MNWTVEETDHAVQIVRMRYNGDFEQKVLLRADAHHDNPKCLQDLERKHLDQALALGAPIVDAGDLFCAMQGKYDKRSSKEDVRPEHLDGNYLDALVQTAIDFYSPYRENFVAIGFGNHEKAIEDRHETSLTGRLCRALKVPKGGWRGVVRFVFEHESGGRIRKHDLFYDHGNGGGGQGSKGVHKYRDRAMIFPGASVILTGHIHEAWYLEAVRWDVDGRGRITKDTQYHLCTPTYKDEFQQVGKGWVDTKGMPPKPLGAWWMTFFYESGDIKIKFERAT